MYVIIINKIWFDLEVYYNVWKVNIWSTLIWKLINFIFVHTYFTVLFFTLNFKIKFEYYSFMFLQDLYDVFFLLTFVFGSFLFSLGCENFFNSFIYMNVVICCFSSFRWIVIFLLGYPRKDLNLRLWSYDARLPRDWDFLYQELLVWIIL